MSDLLGTRTSNKLSLPSVDWFVWNQNNEINGQDIKNII